MQVEELVAILEKFKRGSIWSGGERSIGKFEQRFPLRTKIDSIVVVVDHIDFDDYRPARVTGAVHVILFDGTIQTFNNNSFLCIDDLIPV